MDIEDATVLITGGTGSFGSAFTKKFLMDFRPKRVIVFSRDEMKQWEMAKQYGGDSRVRFFIGDVRDRERLYRAVEGVDIVVHAAATKIVTTAEYNPFEAVKTNVIGAMNVVDACIDRGVRRVVALSTDKASSPINLYGATKLASDKLFISGNHYAGDKQTRFSVVRFGNVMGSRGSVIPFFLERARAGGPLPITDTRMTRFMITLEDAVGLVLEALTNMSGGETYVKKIPTMGILEVAEAVAPGVDTQVVGIRPGEKLHEQMIGSEEAPLTYEYEDFYKILPVVNTWDRGADLVGEGKLVEPGFSYASDTNTARMTIPELQAWLKQEGLEG